MRARGWFVTALCVAACATWLLLESRDEATIRDASASPPTPQTDAAHGTAILSNSAPNVHEGPSSTSTLGAPALTSPLPGSLSGTDVDGALHTDASGRFVADADAVRLFEYFLSARGELDDAALRALIVREIDARLPASARAEAARFLDQYLAYRGEAGDLTSVSDDPADLHRAADALSKLRRDTFGDALAEKLFGHEEDLRIHALERRLIVGDETLSETEKRARLDALDRELPEPVRRAREEASRPLDVHARIEALRAQGADDAQIHAARVEAVGADAADRLRALDARRRELEGRIASFKAQRNALRQDPRLSPEAREGAVQALFERTFAEGERARARVLTRDP